MKWLFQKYINKHSTIQLMKQNLFFQKKTRFLWNPNHPFRVKKGFVYVYECDEMNFASVKVHIYTRLFGGKRVSNKQKKVIDFSKKFLKKKSLMLISAKNQCLNMCINCKKIEQTCSIIALQNKPALLLSSQASGRAPALLPYKAVFAGVEIPSLWTKSSDIRKSFIIKKKWIILVQLYF